MSGFRPGSAKRFSTTSKGGLALCLRAGVGNNGFQGPASAVADIDLDGYVFTTEAHLVRATKPGEAAASPAVAAVDAPVFPPWWHSDGALLDELLDCDSRVVGKLSGWWSDAGE